ncbi:MAG TPA: SMR family transporter [Wenzhouxiangella sp.]|nr:SMR family transporter [Wenzhouxiangella sp.]
MQTWLYLAAAIVAEVIGTSFLKSSEGFTRLWPSLAVGVFYLVSFFFLSVTLKHLSVGVAYAIWAGAGIALIALIGYVLFGQKLDAAALAGIGLIIVGVVVINVFSSAASAGG